jgi:hypothetical protein
MHMQHTMLAADRGSGCASSSTNASVLISLNVLSCFAGAFLSRLPYTQNQTHAASCYA